MEMKTVNIAAAVILVILAIAVVSLSELFGPISSEINGVVVLAIVGQNTAQMVSSEK